MDVKITNTGASVACENEAVDSGRRRALARLGLAAAVGYTVPTLLSLTSVHAGSSGASGGGSGGSGGTTPTTPTIPPGGTGQ
jgi:hypothetical protein